MRLLKNSLMQRISSMYGVLRVFCSLGRRGARQVGHHMCHHLESKLLDLRAARKGRVSATKAAGTHDEGGASAAKAAQHTAQRQCLSREGGGTHSTKALSQPRRQRNTQRKGSVSATKAVGTHDEGSASAAKAVGTQGEGGASAAKAVENTRQRRCRHQPLPDE